MTGPLALKQGFATALDSGGGTLQNMAPVVGMLAGSMSKYGKTYRKDLKKRADQLASGELGFSEAQRGQMRMEAQRAAEQSMAPIMEDLLRKSLAGGANQAALTAMSQEASNAAATAQGDINTASQQQAERSANQIRGELIAQRDKVANDWTVASGSVGREMQTQGQNLKKSGSISDGDLTDVGSAMGAV